VFPKTDRTALDLELTMDHGFPRDEFSDYMVNAKDDIPTGLEKVKEEPKKDIIPSVSITGVAFLGLLFLILVAKKWVKIF